MPQEQIKQKGALSERAFVCVCVCSFFHFSSSFLFMVTCYVLSMRFYNLLEFCDLYGGIKFEMFVHFLFLVFLVEYVHYFASHSQWICLSIYLLLLLLPLLLLCMYESCANNSNNLETIYFIYSTHEKIVSCA